MKSRAMLFFWLAIALLTPLTLLSQTNPAAQTGQPQVELPLINSSTRIITGTLVPATTVQTDPNDPKTLTVVPAACSFSVSLAPNQQAIEVRRTSDISMDAANKTCNAQFEVGEPPVETTQSAAELANEANTTTSSSSGAPSQTDSATSAQVLPAASVVSAGFLKTWWIDPVKIKVNSVQNSTEWRWSGAGHCVTGLLGGQDLHWFTLSGWFLASDHWQNTFTCSETTSASTVLYDNPVFCNFVSTFALYAPNKVNGRQNGDLVGTWNDQVLGSPCVSLLRFRMQIHRTQN